MNAMILAAGQGKRMMPLTKNTPKPLIRLHQKALIEYSIESLKKANITNIVINTFYLGEQIQSHLGDGKQWGVHIQYSTEQSTLETAGGIIQALPLLGSQPFIVINSDVLCDYDLSNLTLPINSLAHLVLINNPKHNLTGDFSLNKTELTLPNKKTYTFSGIGIYHPNFFKEYLQSKDKLPLYPLFKRAISNKQLTGEYHQGYWQDVGTPERLKLITSNTIFKNK